MTAGGLFRRGHVWWICLYRDGRRIRESLRTTDEDVAERRAAKLQRTRERGAYLAPAERRVTVDELLDDLALHLEVQKRASRDKLASHMKAVRRHLGPHRVTEINTAMLEAVQAEWLGGGAAPATINRRYEGLRQAFRLAAQRTPPKVKTVPHIPMLTEDNARQGFLSRADYDALRVHIEDEDVRDFIDWFYWTGMRPNEIRHLTWQMMDQEAGTITLDPSVAKTRTGRVIAISGPLEGIVARRVQRRRLDCPLIFHRVSRGKAGQPVGKYLDQWRTAVKAAGLPPGLIPYDLRRTALRNMIRAGTPVAVAMKISGHRSLATFNRYNIVDETDVRIALERTEAFVAQQDGTRKVRPFPATATKAATPDDSGTGSD